MRLYAYFPGCSLEGTGYPIEISIKAIAKSLDINLIELEDWNCCGSAPYMGFNTIEAVCMSARNLALAEKTGLNLVTPCSSCYQKLTKVNILIKENPKIKSVVEEALKAVNLQYKGTVRVRHLVEVLVNDIGYKEISAKAKRRLNGLKVACYYGCQLIRPKYNFDDPEFPKQMDVIAQNLGCEVVPFPLKARCCGGALAISQMDLALELQHKLLGNATANGAQCIVLTTCPLCYTSLDVYQKEVNKKFKTKFNIPILPITQLVGIALGLDYKTLGLDKNIISPRELLKPFV